MTLDLARTENNNKQTNITEEQNAMTESVECRLPMQKVGSSILGPVKPMMYDIGACHFLA